jgi:arylsulfatase A-like enzyme
MWTRREFLGSVVTETVAAPAQRAPNVVLIITDDQGFGDLSLHGNDKLSTPHIDSLARDGVEFTQFQVSPVCAPTRASLMTGRYNYRTGVVDTYLGRAMMHADEVTLAEMLGAAGYRCGIFGKWHLGDNHPLRAVDQGFHEALTHNGGGIGQPSDPPGGSTYQDPLLFHNGRLRRYQGYCTDVFTTAALGFIEQNRGVPFFVYLSPNAPHTPLQVDERLAEPFRKLGLDETTARVYAMVRNIDENVGRLLARLEKLRLAENTLVIFMTDNGPQQKRYNAGMRGLKGTVYQGGIRVPFLIRWPRALPPGRKIGRLAAHIDIAPTLLDACGVRKPEQVKFDGVSLMPLLRGQEKGWPERTLFAQWHRGDEPQPFRSAAVRTQRWKLIDGKELYDLEEDPAESQDVSARHPEIVARLRREYERWFEDVSSTRGYAPPRIYLGTKHENPVTLTRQDWRGPQAAWTPEALGYWEVDVREAGRYRIQLRFAPRQEAGTAEFRLGDVRLRQEVPPGAGAVTFSSVALGRGAGRLEAELVFGGSTVGVNFVDVEKR